KLLINEQTYQDFKSKYLAIYDSLKNDEEGKASILDDIDFGIELMHTDKINVDYIMNLIRNIDFSDKENKEKDIKHIIKELDRADSEHLRLKIDLLKSFLEEVVPNLTEEDSIDDAYRNFQDIKRNEEIKAFAEQAAVKEEKLKDYISEYEYSGMIDRKDMNDNIEGKLLKRKKVLREMTTFIKNHVEKFN
ncbi:TPA: type I restriction endonuclease subunit R, EcoR124 family, partial [Clostridium botulinum]